MNADTAAVLTVAAVLVVAAAVVGALAWWWRWRERKLMLEALLEIRAVFIEQGWPLPPSRRVPARTTQPWDDKS